MFVLSESKMNNRKNDIWRKQWAILNWMKWFEMRSIAFHIRIFCSHSNQMTFISNWIGNKSSQSQQNNINRLKINRNKLNIPSAQVKCKFDYPGAFILNSMSWDWIDFGVASGQSHEINKRINKTAENIEHTRQNHKSNWTTKQKKMLKKDRFDSLWL